MPEAKPYSIPKQLVWEAYQRVKANRGAAGVDGESLAAFEKDLKRNLYKIWNRMSSGSYFPPPVRLVEIPKDNGGTRPLGTPDRRTTTCGKSCDPRNRWTPAPLRGKQQFKQATHLARVDPAKRALLPTETTGKVQGQETVDGRPG